MAGNNQKMKLLCLLKILMENTDENHTMSAIDLCKALEDYGVSAERKSIYSDITVLQNFGIDVVQKRGTNSGYYIGGRDFELPELKLLVDAVQSSKFITKKKSEELIKKLEGFTSKFEARQLHRDVYIYNRLKTENETIFYNVDYIHTAMSRNVRISFQYAEWTVKKTLKLKKNGEIYTVSPWALTWDDANYYLIAYDESAGIIKHFRVDKMKNTNFLEGKRLGKEQFEQFDLAAYSKKTFGMYSGYDETVTLLCHNSLAGVVIDRFGHDVWMIPADEEHFKAKVLVSVSRQFFGWVTAIGDQMKIAGPKRVQDEYREYLRAIIESY